MVVKLLYIYIILVELLTLRIESTIVFNTWSILLFSSYPFSLFIFPAIRVDLLLTEQQLSPGLLPYLIEGSMGCGKTE
jgi:hypothetical protein